MTINMQEEVVNQTSVIFSLLFNFSGFLLIFKWHLFRWPEISLKEGKSHES